MITRESGHKELEQSQVHVNPFGVDIWSNIQWLTIQVLSLSGMCQKSAGNSEQYLFPLFYIS